MKKVLSVLFFVLIVSLLFSETHKRPKNVPKEAKWKEKYKTWCFRNKRNGVYNIWYQDGSFKHKETIIKSGILKGVNFYHSNKIERLGYSMLLNFNNEKMWIAFGKWVDYYENGNIKMIQCYTPYEDSTDGLVDALCGDEIHYDEKGKETKRVSHKLKCQYGCDFYKE